MPLMKIGERLKWWADPRRLVLTGFCLALAFVVALAVVLIDALDRTSGSIEYTRVAVQDPLSRLGDVLAANSAGEALLQSAVATTGDERNSYLAEAIVAGEASAEAWTKFQSVALGLPGEAALVTRYERHYAAERDIGGDIMVPIVRSNVPGILPVAQIAAAERNRHDVIRLRTLYQRERDSSLRRIERRLRAVQSRLVVGAGLVGAMVLIGGVLALRGASRLVADRRRRATAAALAEFESRLMRALELADGDDDAFAVAAKAVTEIEPDMATSVLASNASGASFTPIVGVASCGVKAPERCPAIRAGSPLQFPDSTALDACPVLGAGAESPCSVTCMPVSAAGRDVAVVQMTGVVDLPPAIGDEIRVVVRRLGERITLLRAFARSELQASRDPLTGLYNRRSLEAAVDKLDVAGMPYTVAFADLDHFKRLNDVHGHHAGDRALRAFAQTMRTSLRPEDLTGRWGGEEFLVVLPGCGQRRAVDAMNRVRHALTSSAFDGLDPVTVSVGVAEGAPGELFAAIVARADDALHRAKAEGRDQVTAWSPQTATDAKPEPVSPLGRSGGS